MIKITIINLDDSKTIFEDEVKGFALATVKDGTASNNLMAGVGVGGSMSVSGYGILQQVVEGKLAQAVQKSTEHALLQAVSSLSDQDQKAILNDLLSEANKSEEMSMDAYLKSKYEYDRLKDNN